MVDMADSGNSIREKAEKKLARSKRGPADSKTLTEDEILHELHVHQFELEIQNETLRESQVALQESRDQYSNLYDYAPVGYLSLDENTNIIKGNLTGAAMLGITRSGLINYRFGKFVFKKDIHSWNQYFASVLHSKEKQVCELRLRKSDRSIINVRLESVQLIQKDTDQTVLLTLSDITDRVRAEENLAQNLAQKSNDLDKLKLAYETIAKDQEKIRRSEEKYRETSQYLEKLINYANAPIIVWDPGFRIIRFNHAFERLTGRSSDSVIGQQLSLLFPENKREELMNFIRGTLTGSQWEAVEIPIQDTNGHVKIVLWNSATLFCEDGKTVLSVIAQGQDITERKRVEADLKKSEADIKEALAEKEVLLSEIHHRVKNNLTAFISLLSLDGSYEDSDSGRALRKDLQNRARSMALIHETLYKTGKFSNVDMEIYLKNLVGQIAQSYGSRAVINVVVEVNGTLKIDQATTAGLIINELVTNSFKYAFPPGFDCMAVRGAPCTIRVSLANEDGTDVLRVSDNGCGFHKGFDPLSSKSLGLKLVNFLAHHQLRADISIQRDKGIEFIFRLKNTRNEAK